MTAIDSVGDVAEFVSPPDDPEVVLQSWLEHARSAGVPAPTIVALATTDARGRSSSRIIRALEVSTHGILFTSHSVSQKSQDISTTGWASGVLYWPETNEQIIVAGPAFRLSDEESDGLWHARPSTTHAMSTASMQSAVLHDEDALRRDAEALGTEPLPRPERFLGYRLVPSSIEFWRSGPGGLHRRLRYDRAAHGWTHRRLQP
ncbi:pyridoxal 5'-phosphate synthase [Pseudonocardiaceae bacterium YIM PH 21723]|nr:pyridoxal 5'-phosphate synthase [Pseudonocardiaceae bacterium YIM PH 21723]